MSFCSKGISSGKLKVLSTLVKGYKNCILRRFIDRKVLGQFFSVGWIVINTYLSAHYLLTSSLKLQEHPFR